MFHDLVGIGQRRDKKSFWKCFLSFTKIKMVMSGHFTRKVNDADVPRGKSLLEISFVMALRIVW